MDYFTVGDIRKLTAQLSIAPDDMELRIIGNNIDATNIRLDLCEPAIQTDELHERMIICLWATEERRHL